VRGLKTLVIVLGVLLIGGVAALVATIAWRASHPPRPAPQPTPPSLANARAPFESVLALPQGAEIVSIQPAGERLILQLRLPGGGGQLMIIDIGSGARLGTLELRPGS
jgi:hypothetical protein